MDYDDLDDVSYDSWLDGQYDDDEDLLDEEEYDRSAELAWAE